MRSRAREPKVIVLSSPSGGGKSSIAKAILASRPDTAYSVSATTRPPRAGEQEGKHYYFLTPAEFARRRANGEMLEWAEYSGHQYGTLKTEIDRVLARGQHALLDIEVEGTRHLRQRRSDVVTIFILPPSAETLVERLGGRKSDSAEQVAARIRRAVEELAEVPLYDHVVVNDDLDAAVRDVSAIIDGAVSTVREVQDLDECLAALRNGLQQYVEGGRLTD